MRLTPLSDPLLMNAFNGVNLSAACILTSTEHAEKLGIPKDRWIYVLGGAGTHEKDDCKTPLRHEHLKPSTLTEGSHSLGETAFAP